VRNHPKEWSNRCETTQMSASKALFEGGHLQTGGGGVHRAAAGGGHGVAATGGRGSHSCSSQLNLSCLCRYEITTQTTERVPEKALTSSRKVEECKPLGGGGRGGRHAVDGPAAVSL